MTHEEILKLPTEKIKIPEGQNILTFIAEYFGTERDTEELQIDDGAKKVLIEFE